MELVEMICEFIGRIATALLTAISFTFAVSIVRRTDITPDRQDWMFLLTVTGLACLFWTYLITNKEPKT